MDETQTRRQLIDRRLGLAGWDVANPSQVIQELDIELRDAGEPVAGSEHDYSGHQFSDYGLLLDSKPVAVVEAKRASRSAFGASSEPWLCPRHGEFPSRIRKVGLLFGETLSLLRQQIAEVQVSQRTEAVNEFGSRPPCLFVLAVESSRKDGSGLVQPAVDAPSFQIAFDEFGKSLDSIERPPGGHLGQTFRDQMVGVDPTCEIEDLPETRKAPVVCELPGSEPLAESRELRL